MWAAAMVRPLHEICFAVGIPETRKHVVQGLHASISSFFLNGQGQRCAALLLCISFWSIQGPFAAAPCQEWTLWAAKFGWSASSCKAHVHGS